MIDERYIGVVGGVRRRVMNCRWTEASQENVSGSPNSVGNSSAIDEKQMNEVRRDETGDSIYLLYVIRTWTATPTSAR